MAIDEWERERWRGQTSARIEDIEESMMKLWAWKEQADRDLAVIKTKLIVFAALAAGIGAAISNVVAALVKHP